jgi:TRAP-type C4-dicarboxylate transport system substrate-binding protein
MALRWHTEIRHCADLPIVNILGGLLVTKKAYQKVPESYQKILKDLSKKYMTQLLQKAKEGNEDTVKVLKEQYNVKFLKPDDQLVEEMKVFSQKVADGQVGTLYSKELLAEVRGIITEYRKSK